VILLVAVFKVKVICDSSENDPTRVTKSEELQGKEETGNSDSFKPTHEWQPIKEGKLVIARLN
jgi:hypothetical protein